MRILLIMFGGAIGSLLRYFATAGFARIFGKDFPFGTLFVNVTGSFLLGFFTMLFLQKATLSEDVRLALTIGLLGAFTTFSTFSFETVQLFEHGDYVKAIANILLNLSLSILAVVIGMMLAK